MASNIRRLMDDRFVYISNLNRQWDPSHGAFGEVSRAALRRATSRSHAILLDAGLLDSLLCEVVCPLHEVRLPTRYRSNVQPASLATSLRRMALTSMQQAVSSISGRSDGQDSRTIGGQEDVSCLS